MGPTHLEQDADGGGHAHHADAHHRHLVPAAHRLLLHDMADQLLLGGHLCKEKPVEEGEGLNKGTRGVVEVGGGERAGGMSHLNWKSDLVGGGEGGTWKRKETEKRKAKKERKTAN